MYSTLTSSQPHCGIGESGVSGQRYQPIARHRVCAVGRFEPRVVRLQKTLHIAGALAAQRGDAVGVDVERDTVSQGGEDEALVIGDRRGVAQRCLAPILAAGQRDDRASLLESQPPQTVM